MAIFLGRTALLALLAASSVYAHGDHSSVPSGVAISDDPIVCSFGCRI